MNKREYNKTNKKYFIQNVWTSLISLNTNLVK